MKLYSIRNRTLREQSDNMENETKEVRISGVVLLLVAVLLIAVTAAVCLTVSNRIYKNRLEKERTYKVLFSSETDPYKLAKLQDIIDFVSKDFALEYTGDQLVEGAIDGYVNALGDRYSYYIKPGDYSSYNDYITGTYAGIGIATSFSDEGMTITDVFEDTPAKEAGLSVGELITHVNGLKIGTSEASQVGSMLGQEGVIVKLTVVGLDGITREVEMKTAIISRQSVFGMGYEDGVYYIRISQFDSDTGDEFNQMIKVAENGGMKALVLDLRGNPGGYERQADMVADTLLGEGIIAYSEDKNGKRASEVKSDAAELNVPVVLLVNANTASASELVAGAFRDFKKGTIVGKRTFGKAIGQISRSYSEDGSGIVLTVATYFTPSGECIHGVGIAPDVEISLKAEYENLTPDKIPAGEDAQLEKAFELVRSKLPQ